VRYLLFALIIVCNPLFAQKDSSFVLSFDEYLTLVKAYHPVVKQADLQLSRGAIGIQKAKGAFDPKAFTDIRQKYFKDKPYYSLIHGGLKVPTWFGIELSSGYERNDGLFLNPENNVPQEGLWYAGVKVPLGKGLFIDKRRADLKKARLFQTITEAERQLILNELIYKAGVAYWEWFNAYHVMKVYENAQSLAQVRLDAVKKGVALGDKPAIDTVEASLQLQNRVISYQKAQVNFQNATALLSVFLWGESNLPLEIAENAKPSSLDAVEQENVQGQVAFNADTLMVTHPKLQQTRSKLDQLAVDIRLKREALKPTVNLMYKGINAPKGGNPFADYSISNYTWGVEFQMPLLIRKERADVKLAQIKAQEAALGLENAKAELRYKARSSLNDWQLSGDQVRLYATMVQDYRRLLDGEKIRFGLGESSLFMVNSREKSYINAQVKFIESLQKNQKSSLKFRYTLGVLPDES